LRELGYDDATIARLNERNVIGLPHDQVPRALALA
jgi:hypothetical protein